MQPEALVERLFETLITGDRQATRRLVTNAEKSLGGPAQLISELFWPVHQLVEKLYRADQLTRLSHHLAVRLLRVMADQTAAKLAFAPTRSRTVLACCGPSESEELGAQMAVDLLESSGFEVRFAGAGIAADEILGKVNEDKPDILLMFCSAPQDLPEIRGLIDTIREIGAAANTQVAVGGGVFNRAEGLAEEIGADIWATTPMEMIETLIEEPTRRAETAQRTVGRTRRKAKAA